MEYLDVDSPKNLDPATTAFVAGVPPFSLHHDLISALGVARDAKVEKTSFALGDIRTVTYHVKAAGIASLHGSLLKSAHESLVILSPDAFVRAKSAATMAAAARKFTREGGSSSQSRSIDPTGPGGQFNASYFSVASNGSQGPTVLTPAGGLPAGGPPRTPGDADPGGTQSSTSDLDASGTQSSAGDDKAVDELLD